MKKTFIVLFFFFLLVTQSCEKWKDYPCDNVHTKVVGATCNDGTHSDATGAGACSSHGGVRNWLCN
jgi:hypothetical protein